jgi:hypothetical protein
MKKTSITLLALALALVGLASCEKHVDLTTVHGRLVLALEEGYTGSSTCHGIGPWSEDRAGRELRMREGTGSRAIPIDVAKYSEGHVTTYGCEFTFEFHIPKGMKQYTVFNCHDDGSCQRIGLTWSELKGDGFKLDWCKGCDGGALGGGGAVGGDAGGSLGGT